MNKIIALKKPNGLIAVQLDGFQANYSMPAKCFMNCTRRNAAGLSVIF